MARKASSEIERQRRDRANQIARQRPHPSAHTATRGASDCTIVASSLFSIEFTPTLAPPSQARLFSCYSIALEARLVLDLQRQQDAYHAIVPGDGQNN